MKNLIAVLAFVMVSQAHAQMNGVNQYDDAVVVQSAPAVSAQPRRTVIYDERTNELVEIQPEVVESQQAPGVSSSPIYIMNSQNQKYSGYQGQAQIQEQPTTLIQDTPLTVSPAEQMRRKRQDAETQTEDGIVQALEKARMEDEIRRRQRFNGAIGTGPSELNSQPMVAPTYIQPAPPPVVQQVVPAPAVTTYPVSAGQDEDEDKVDIRSEIRAALEETKAKPEKGPESYYISGQVGLGKYPDVVNVRGNVATGFSVGLVTPERIVVEGSFMLADYELEDVFYTMAPYPGFSRIVDMRQYNLGAAVKYKLLPGRLQPNVGAMVSYTRRTMTEYDVDFRTSDAFDIGLVAGVDLQLTDSLAIGFDFRYLTNVAYREKTETRSSFVYPQSRNEIEKLDYYLGTLTGKFTF